MKKIIDYFGLPILALVIILIIYFGLTLRNLQSQNQKLVANVGNLTQQFNESNDNLTQQLAQSQKQISALQQSNSQTKTVLATSSTKSTPIIQSVTQEVTKEVVKKEAIQATVTIQNIGSFKVDLSGNDTAFSVTKKAAEQYGFGLKYTLYSFGAFVTSIGNIAPSGSQYWAFYYNGAYSNVGASDQKISKDNNIFWQLASF